MVRCSVSGFRVSGLVRFYGLEFRRGCDYESPAWLETPMLKGVEGRRNPPRSLPPPRSVGDGVHLNGLAAHGLRVVQPTNSLRSLCSEVHTA